MIKHGTIPRTHEFAPREPLIWPWVKVKAFEVTTQWLRGHRYQLVATKERVETYYQWHDDGGMPKGNVYRSYEMARVHFGDW
jgi:hypothetical protein